MDKKFSNFCIRAVAYMNISMALEWSKKLKKETYFTNPLSLSHWCFVKDGKLYDNDLIDGKHPLLVYSETYADVSHQMIELGFDEDIKSLQKKYALEKIIPIATEYHYSTDEWISLEGKKFKDIRKGIEKFKREHNVTILHNYPREKVIEFITSWADGRRKKNAEEKKTPDLAKIFFEQDLKDSLDNVDLINTIDHKAIYLEEKGALIGFCIFFKYYDTFWIALMQKTLLGIRGLPQYLYHLKAKEMGTGNTFTTGSEAKDEQLQTFKESLQPITTKKICAVYVGEKR